MSALGMASLGTQCANKALGMASIGVFCDPGVPVTPPQTAPGLGGSGGSGGNWRWISDLEQPSDKKTLRIKRVELPPTDLGRAITEQIMREDDELLLLVIALIESGVI